MLALAMLDIQCLESLGTRAGQRRHFGRRTSDKLSGRRQARASDRRVHVRSAYGEAYRPTSGDTSRCRGGISIDSSRVEAFMAAEKRPAERAVR